MKYFMSDSELVIVGADNKWQIATYILAIGLCLVASIPHLPFTKVSYSSTGEMLFTLAIAGSGLLLTAYGLIMHFSLKVSIRENYLTVRMWLWNWKSNGNELYLRPWKFSGGYGWCLILTNHSTNKYHMMLFFSEKDLKKAAKLIQNYYGEKCTIVE